MTQGTAPLGDETQEG